MDYAFWHAIKVGDPTPVARLLGIGADLKAKDAEGKTALHLAADWGHAAVVVLLIKWGADLNACDRTLKTPLHQAACWGHMDVMKVLLKSGALPDAQDLSGYTPLHYAVSMSNSEAVKLLLTHGADPAKTARDGKDAHSLASSAGIRNLLGTSRQSSSASTNSHHSGSTAWGALTGMQLAAAKADADWMNVQDPVISARRRLGAQ